jgi:HSP20 family protein
MAQREQQTGGTAVQDTSDQQSARTTEGKGSRSGRGTAVAPAATGGTGLPFFGPAFTATPFTLLRRVNEDFNQLFDALLRGGTDPGLGSRGERGALAAPTSGFGEIASFVPQIEVERRKDALVVRADLAGVNPDDIEVTVDNGMLVIAGERRQERREDREGYTEFTYGTFLRTIPLPDGADENRLTATMQNGTLEITIPVAAKERGRRVRVQQQS